MSVLEQGAIIFDEKTYSIAWRFNSLDCTLSDTDKSQILLLNQLDSQKLWDSLFPFQHLMEINQHTVYCTIVEKIQLDFDDVETSKVFFQQKLAQAQDLIFFWGRGQAARLSSDILIKAWDDFFYPSDENCICYMANQSKVIFSYEDTFFYAKIL